MTKRGNNPVGIGDIISYWAGHVDESNLGTDFADAHERCWRCGWKRKLERCHIIPKSLGGNDTPGNLVLLCHQCHLEAPNCKDPSAMWEWITRTHAIFYDEPPWMRLFSEVLREATIHFGQGGLNTETMSWVFGQMASRLKSGV